MRRRRNSKFTAKHWLILAAIALAAVILIICLIDLSTDTSFLRDPVYLPQGDIVFIPKD